MTTDLDDITLQSRIEDAGLNASAPPQQCWVDGWLVRFSPGKAKRARCINAVCSGRLPLDQRLATCQTLYDQHQLALVVRITPFTQPRDLDQRLAALGYTAADQTSVMVSEPLQTIPSQQDLDLSMVSSEAFAHIVGRFRGTDPISIAAHSQRLQNSPVACEGFVVHDADQRVVACALMATEGELVGLYDVFTAPAARGKGLSRRLCGQLMQRAARKGARRAYLQVEAGNHAARSAYIKLGLKDAYSYHYRALPRAPATVGTA